MSSFRYVGYTSNINQRLNEHNSGMHKSTKPYLPFELDAFIAVQTIEKAQQLEQYFKTGSDNAFARKRILTYEALAK